MKAAVCREFGKPLVIEDIDIDPPRDGEVMVRLSACAICHSDILSMEGAWGGREKLPAIFGHEAAGIVEALGPGVAGLTPGDHVIASLIRSCGHCYYCVQGDQHLCETEFPLDRESRLHAKGGEAVHQGLRTGAFAEFTVVDRSQVVVIPETLPLDSACLLACGVITGLGAVVNTAKLASGSSVVVIGAGGVGLNSIQGAAIAGANPVIAIDLVKSKLETAREFGASHAIDPVAEDARKTVRSLTGGRGADYVFVTVGSVRAIEQGLAMLRRAGTLVIVGMPPSGVTVAIEPVEFASNGQRILGSKMGSSRLAVDVPRLVALYQAGRLKLDELISARYSLHDINQAIAEVNRGKVLRNVIMFDGDGDE